MTAQPPKPKILFVTGKLAEPALRRLLSDLAPKAGFEAIVAVLPISVAALMTCDWIARHLKVPDQVQRVVLPGYCRGDLSAVPTPQEVSVELGPKDLRDLPEFFGARGRHVQGLDVFDIEILAEINHAPDLARSELLAQAHRLRDDGADVIDIGCNPGDPWPGIEDATRALVNEGFRVSVDSFNSHEVESALRGGAQLALSVNGSNLANARRWHEHFPEVEVVAVPDRPTDVASLDGTVEALMNWNVAFRIDPIIEPIGFGFAASLGRYLAVRKRYPDAEIMMGIGNVTELTDADSCGINVMLAGFCQELGIRSVLTTQVINWCRSAVKEFDLARKLVYHAVSEQVLPKHLSDELILLRDPKLYEMGDIGLMELARQITDRNYRIFVERGEIHVLNGTIYVHGTDPFALFGEMEKADPKLDRSHSFYLGYELAKAVTALTLGKNYTQDQALRWGFLTVPEISHQS